MHNIEALHKSEGTLFFKVRRLFFIAGEEYPLIVSKEENLLVNPLPCPPVLSLASPLPGSLDIPSVFP